MYLQRAGHGGVTESVACRVSLGRRLNVRALAVRLAHKTSGVEQTNKLRERRVSAGGGEAAHPSQKWGGMSPGEAPI